MKRPPNRGFTLIELLVVISIIAILASLAVPAVISAMTRGQLIQTVSNGRELQQITMSADLDATTTGDTNIISWPGNTTNSFPVWVVTLTNATLDGNTLAKLFSAPGVSASWTATGPNVSAFTVYSVSDTSTPNTIFLTTQNWTANSGTNGTGTLSNTGLPYGQKGFVVVHQGGDAASYSSQQATNSSFGYGTNAISGMVAP